MGDRRLGDVDVRQETRRCETGDQEMGSRRQEMGDSSVMLYPENVRGEVKFNPECANN